MVVYLVSSFSQIQSKHEGKEAYELLGQSRGHNAPDCREQRSAEVVVIKAEFTWLVFGLVLQAV